MISGKTKSILIAVYTFFISICPYLLSNLIEVFASGARADNDRSWFFERLRAKVLGKFSNVSNPDPDGRYKQCLPLIKPHSKVVDLGCGGGRLQKVLEKYDATVDYMGVDNDVDYVNAGRANGLDIRLLNLNDENGLVSFMSEEKPDIVFFNVRFLFCR